MNGNEKTVLIVDDEYYAVQGIAKNVKWERLGVGKTYAAYSREQAERILREHPVDILLTDIEMPGGSGLSLIEWVRKSGYTPFVLILTGHQRFDYAHKAINLRCDGYILKPVDILEVEENLRSLLGTGAHPAQEQAGPLAEVGEDEESFVARVRQTILQNISSPELNRAFIAQAVHINEDYLSYLFHIKFGQTLSSYITFLRMDAAKELLSNTKYSLQRVSEKVGFSSSSYFSKKFKKATGMTPQQFREKERHPHEVLFRQTEGIGEMQLKQVMEKLAASGWERIAAPAQQWLEGNMDREELIEAVKQAAGESGSCGCELDLLYKQALELL